MNNKDLQDFAELLLMEFRAANKIKKKLLNEFHDIDLIDISYNDELDCVDFIFDVDDGYCGRIEAVHGDEELLKQIGEV